MSAKRVLLVGLAMLLVLGGGLAYWRFFKPIPVTVLEVVRGTVPLRVVGPGTVQARVPVTISARITSTVVDVKVDVGDIVAAGQDLVILDDRDLVARVSAVGGQQVSLARQIEAADAAVAKARADLSLAQSRQKREIDLQRKGFVSQASLDSANAAAGAAEAALDAAVSTLAARKAEQATLAQEATIARTQLGYTRLASPMSALVTQRLVEPGTTVAPGIPILRLVDPQSLWVATRVDESVVSMISPGQTAAIMLRSGERMSGRVARIAMQSDAATRELDVHVAFDDTPARVAIDQEAEVTIHTGQQGGLLVSLESIVRNRDGEVGVLRIIGGRARFVPVQLGRTGGGKVVVLDGLEEGDLVVADARDVKAGARVNSETAPTSGRD